MSLRVRRLNSDYESLYQLSQSLSYLAILDTKGSPPERYLLEFDLKSLRRRGDGGVSLATGGHQVEIYLTHAYPRQAPQCRMRTEIFHPNIAPHAICVADHWTAGESLADLVLRIAQMISLQAYNTKSPLDGDAARWVEENIPKLPIDRRDLMPQDEETSGRLGCSHCNVALQASESIRCQDGHFVCARCARSCPECAAVRCLECELTDCSTCSSRVCPDCTVTCPACWKEQCARHLVKCHRCDAEACGGCIDLCRRCGKGFCTEHRSELQGDDRPLCKTCQITRGARRASTTSPSPHSPR